MDADYYLETIKTVFQEYKLVKGTWDVISAEGKTERVTPGDITTTAVMTVEGELDDISGAGQTQAALAMCSGVPDSQKKHLEAKGAGHYGIFSGRRWREVVYPSVKAFILEHNKSLTEEKKALPLTSAPVKPVTGAVAKVAAEPQVTTPAAPAAEAPAKVAISMAAARTATKPTAQAAVPSYTRPNGKPTPKVPRRK
jgi:poly(3-hydroxybutyrate) depolymerase